MKKSFVFTTEFLNRTYLLLTLKFALPPIDRSIIGLSRFDNVDVLLSTLLARVHP